MKSRIIKISLIILIFALLSSLLALAIFGAGLGGLEFDGLAEYKTAEVEMSLPLTYEASLLFCEGASGKGGAIFSNYSSNTAPGFTLEITESGAPKIDIIDASGTRYGATFEGISVYTGERLHLAVVLDKAAGTYTAYINGAVAKVVEAAVPDSFSVSSKFALGGDNVAGNPNYFRGELFSLSLYSDVRSDSEIASDAKGDVSMDELIAAYSPLTSESKNITAMGNTAYNITYKCDWVKDATDPSGYDYSFAVIGDIQSLTYYYPDQLQGMYQWIANNAEAKKMIYAVGLGDVTEKNTEAEYQKVVEAYSKIDGIVPFSIIRGNHDRESANTTINYDKYINLERYGDEISGSFNDKMHATYRIIQVGGVKYLFMNLDFVLSDAMVDWANEVISSHPECHVIVSDHIYRNMSGTLLSLDNGKFGAENNPEVLWNEILSQHENIVMCLYGHSPKDQIYKKQREGKNGHLVTEMLINPSETDKAHGGAGLVAMFYFSENGEKLDVRYYSTAKEAYFRADNQFSLTLDTPKVVEFTNVIMNVGASESERNLTWYSQYDTLGEVRYAKSTDGTLPDSYSVANAVAVKASKAGYYSYKATLSGLEANSTYVYTLVVGGQTSACYTFKTGSFGDEFSFGFVTDVQVKEEKHAGFWTDTLEKIKKAFDGVSLLVSAGDQTSDPASEDNFDWFISGELATLPIATTVGPPHDNTLLYKDHYNLPNLSTQYGVSTPSSNYFYTYNNVLFMHLNVENHDYEGHIAFMENAIADNPDCLWRVVVLHFSFFTGGNHSTDGSVLAFREALGAKLSQLDVDLVLGGHDHVYTRSQLMLDGKTVSNDVVANGAVTNPDGTLYICGGSASGSGWYNVEHHDDDEYIAFTEDTNRKSVVIFTVTEGSLTLKSYFVDGSTPELFDTFTINKTKRPVRLDGSTDMLEILDGGERVALVNAYAYSSAIVKAVGGYWSVSTDGGASFVSLGVPTTNTTVILRIGTDGIWEMSCDGGLSYNSLGIATKTYSVRYVLLPGAMFGDNTPLDAYPLRRYTAASPDEVALYMPLGSIKAGALYDWEWRFYLADGDGAAVSSFEYGKEYIAYPVSTNLPVSNTIYIASSRAPEEYTYTWGEVWGLVSRLSGEKLTLVLRDDITLVSGDEIALALPVDLTLDLGGKRLDTSALAPAIKLGVGTNGSIFRVVTSVAGGTLNAGLNDFVEIGSNQGSRLTLQYGSEDTEDLTVESIKYLVGANGNFKYSSTLNLSVYGGSYKIARGVIYVSNVTTSAGTNSPNIYKLALNGAHFDFFGGDSAIVRAKALAYFANKASFIEAVGCVFTDTYKTNHTSSRFLIREDTWLGTASFVDCDFVGMAIGADYTGAALASPSAITIGAGCTFTNSKTTFKAGSPISFFSEKVGLASGCVLARTDATGSAEVLKAADAVEIDWQNPVGYKEYWKCGSTPAYLGEDSFTVGDVTYSLLLAEAPSAASANKAYAFKSAEGHPYRYNSASGTWQISTDGGNTYTDLGGGTTPSPDPTPDPEPDPEPDVEVGCTVVVGGVTTTFSKETDFRDVLVSVNTSANAGKEIKITLSADMSLLTAMTFSSAKNCILDIDLAGHTLTFKAGGAFKFGSGYTWKIYSSAEGGEFVFGTTSDGFQAATGTIIFGSESYKNMLTVSSLREMVNPSQLADGSKLQVKCLYTTFNTNARGLIRINAKGAGAVTLEAEIIGCTVNGTSAVIIYNDSTNLAATTNGGVYKKESFIKLTNSVFNCTAENPLGIFSTKNFADRYFGTVSVDGCIFNGYVLNGDAIYSDEALSYNTYYNTIADGYDPNKAITVKNSKFINFGATFNEALSAFSASNISLSEGCVIVRAESGAVLVLDTAEHILSPFKFADGKHWRECTTCNDGVRLDVADCTMTSTVTPPSCAAKGYTTHNCTECGYSYIDTYVDELAHTELAHDAKAPTCDSVGWNAYVTCSKCSYSTYEEIPATGHTEVSHDAKAPTCDSVGWNAYVTCTKCSYSTYEEIPATGHTELSHDAKAPTCDSVGWNAYVTCSKCSYSTYEEIPATGHDWTEATTEAPKTCTVCGATEGEKLPATDDNEGEGGNTEGDNPPVDEHADCHNNWFLNIWNAIVNFFRSWFGLPPVCTCGKEI